MTRTVEYIFDEFFGPDVPLRLPAAGPVAPDHWYLPATEYGQNGQMVTGLTDRAGSSNMSKQPDGTLGPRIVDDGISRYATIFGSSGNSLTNGITFQEPFTTVSLLRAVGGASVHRFWRIGRYHVYRGANRLWLDDLGAANAGKGARVVWDGEWAPVAVVYNGASSRMHIGADVQVSTPEVTGTGFEYQHYLGGWGESDFSLAEHQIFKRALSANQIQAQFAAMTARHAPLIG